VNEYSPKRRTALVFTGSGTSGAYHAGVLKALEESGVKIDLVVGSGAGAIAAAYAAVDGGARLYGGGGFWERVRWRSLFRLRPAVLVVVSLLAASFVAFLMPAVLALLGGLLFPVILIVDRVSPSGPSRFMGGIRLGPESLSGPYLAALAAPIFALALFLLVSGAVLAMRDRRRLAESFESFFDVRPGQERLRHGLWEIARGAALSSGPPSEAAAATWPSPPRTSASRGFARWSCAPPTSTPGRPCPSSCSGRSTAPPSGPPADVARTRGARVGPWSTSWTRGTRSCCSMRS